LSLGELINGGERRHGYDLNEEPYPIKVGEEIFIVHRGNLAIWSKAVAPIRWKVGVIGPCTETAQHTAWSHRLYTEAPAHRPVTPALITGNRAHHRFLTEKALCIAFRLEAGEDTGWSSTRPDDIGVFRERKILFENFG
jgi:hypothetical protein